MRQAILVMSAQELAWALRLPDGTRILELRQDIDHVGTVELIIEGDGLPPQFEVGDGRARYRTRHVTTLQVPKSG